MYLQRAAEQAPTMKYGEQAFTKVAPFLGTMKPGEVLQSLECNMFRAPAVQHTPSDTDFLLIRTRHGFVQYLYFASISIV